MHARRWITLGLALGGTVGACYRYDATYCGNLEGHATCRELGLGQFCSLCSFDKGGCVEARPSSDCLAPFEIPGEEGGSSGDTGSETGGSDTEDSGSGSSATMGSGSSGDGPCTGPEDCPEAAPFCDPVGACVTCDAMEDPDGACAELGGGTPLCVGGTCVACTDEDTSVCDGQLRLCDPETNACVDCTEHPQCESGACQLDVGTCFPTDVVVHVDGDGGQDFTTVGAAIASFNDGALGVIVVHERAASAPYTEALAVDGGKVLAMVAADGESPEFQGVGASPGLAVQGAGTTLYLEALTSADGNAFGLVCDGARADLRRARIVQNTGGGILAQGGCELSVENSFVGGTIDTDALEAQSSTVSVLYSTLAASAMIAGSPAALRCDGSSTVEARNSILVGASPEPEFQCAGATVTTSAGEGDLPGTDNVAVGTFDPGWFANFVGGDFSLTAAGGTAFEGIARWEEGDPSTDINGDGRPTEVGMADVVGADVP